MKAVGENGKRPTGREAYTDGTRAYIPKTVRVVNALDLGRDTQVEADAVVIGSGSGGAVVAKELAEGGMKVVILEEGDHYTTDDLTARPREMSVKLFRDAGQVATIGTPPVLLPMGKAVGGSSLINSATCFRTPPPVLEMWQDRLGLEELTPAALDPFFRRVEREVNVTKVPADVAGRNAEVVKRGADKLGYSGDYIFRNVRGCVGSGVCSFGCPTSAKQHVGITYIPKAWDAGATTYALAKAERLMVESGRARGVEARAGKHRLTVNAAIVVLSAGAIHSPLLLKRQGLGSESGQLCGNLSIHPASGLRALFDEEINMAKGVPQAYYIDEFAGEGIMMEAAAGPPDYAAVTLPFFGKRHRELVERYLNISQFGVMVSDTSRGWVREVAGRPSIRYDLSDADVSRFKKGLTALAEIFWAAGARAIYPPLENVPVLHEGDVDTLKNYPLKAHELDLIAFHPLGTCRMGGDPSNSVLDGNNKLHGFEGLYVADGSIVPSSLGVNPHLTIMCLANRLAYHLLGKDPPREEPEPEDFAKPAVGLAYTGSS